MKTNLTKSRAYGFLRTVFAIIAVFAFLSANNTYGQTYQQVHDPSNPVYSGGKWWIHTTGAGIYRMSKSSLDPLSGWTSGTKVFNTHPSWINNYVSGFSGDFWAPHLSGSDVYYSCSSWGSKNSCIGRATGSPGGTYTDQGLVIYSTSSTSYGNCIDPFVFNGYLLYGSFWEGIHICPLSNLNNRTQLRNGNYEAPAMTQDGSYYYLWYNGGSCCNGCNSTYYVRVARSTSITGPFSGDRTILSSSGRYIGPGCMGFTSTAGGTACWHFYDSQASCAPKLMTGTVSYSGGWPVITQYGSSSGGSSSGGSSSGGSSSGGSSSGGSSSGGSSSGGPSSGSNYRITARHSGKVLDVANCGTSDGTNVQQWAWLNNNCQKWKTTDVGSGYWRISPLNATSKGLDVNGWSTSNGGNIQLWAYNGYACQKFQISSYDGYYRIINQNSGKCLDVEGVSTSNGANIFQWSCGSGQNQQFSFTQVKSVDQELSNTEISIYPNPATKVLNVTAEGSTIEIYNNIGKVVQTVVAKESLTTIDIGSLVSGVYLVKISNGQEVTTQKFTKK